jgi:hypothetical protein
MRIVSPTGAMGSGALGTPASSRARKKNVRAPSVVEPRVKWYGLPIDTTPATAPERTGAAA